MRQLRILFAMSALLAPAACTGVEQPFLSSAELSVIFTGGKFRYSGSAQGNHVSGEMTFHANGNLFFETDSGAPEGGTWKIWSDALCTRLVSLREGQEKCFSVAAAGKKRYETSHGFTLEGPLEEAV